MFKRLNTGGAALSDQEIRNCTARMAGQDGVFFYDFLRECAQVDSFRNCVSSISDDNKDKRGDEELVLRFFALKNAKELFKGSVKDWLDSFMERAVFKQVPFNYDAEKTEFKKLFGLLDKSMGEDAFVRFRGDKPIGGLAPAHFEAITGAIHGILADLEKKDPKDIRNKLIEVVQATNFKEVVGPGSNSLQKFKGRIEVTKEALSELLI